MRSKASVNNRMLASAIRELAASSNPVRIAAGFFSKTVQIWDLNSREMTCEFPTVFCSGAKNLAISPVGGTLVVGLSKSNGKVIAYEIPGGRKLWEQSVIYPSSLSFHPSGESVLCTKNRQSVLRFDIHTGEIVEMIDGAKRYLEEASGDALQVPAKGNNGLPLLIGSSQTHILTGVGSIILDARFSLDSVCLSEMGGAVRCFSRAAGELRWAFEPGARSHVQRLHYSQKLNAFFGVLWNPEKAKSRTLLKFDPETGAREQVCQFDAWEFVFLETMNQLVTSAGEIWDLSNGALVGRLAFPLKEYPDR